MRVELDMVYKIPGFAERPLPALARSGYALVKNLSECSTTGPGVPARNDMEGFGVSLAYRNTIFVKAVSLPPTISFQ